MTCTARRITIAFVVMAARLCGAPATAEKAFTLPAGDAATTLTQFAAQSGEQIVYMVDNVRGEQTNAVNGRLPPRLALERMLAGSALTASQDPVTGALVVGRREPKPVADAPDPRSPAPARRTARP